MNAENVGNFRRKSSLPRLRAVLLLLLRRLPLSLLLHLDFVLEYAAYHENWPVPQTVYQDAIVLCQDILTIFDVLNDIDDNLDSRIHFHVDDSSMAPSQYLQKTPLLHRHSDLLRLPLLLLSLLLLLLF